MTVIELLSTIDKTKMKQGWVDLSAIKDEFEIQEYIVQTEDNVRLTYCFYQSWVCTDTRVGLKLWFFDEEAVCISWRYYRKSKESFSWLSLKDFYKVGNYLNTLKLPHNLLLLKNY